MSEKAQKVTIDDFRAIFEFRRGTSIQKAEACYNLLKNAAEEDKVEFLQYACETYGWTKPTKKASNIEGPFTITDESLEYLKKKYGSTVDSMLESLINDNEDEPSFYRGLLGVINNSFFIDDQAKIFALYWTLLDLTIPYFKIGTGLKMSDAEHFAIKGNIKRSLQMVRFLLNRKFDQKIEKASLILREIYDHSDEAEQAVLLNYLITYLEDNDR